MKSTTFAVALALVAGSAAVSAPAIAQNAAAQPAQWAPKIDKKEAAALQPLQAAVNAKDWATATTALAAAQGSVSSADGRYLLGQFQYVIGNGTNNVQLQTQGIDAMIASGGGDPTKVGTLYQAQGALALKAQDYAKAEAAFSRLAQMSPNDLNTQVALAELKFRQKKPQEALPLFERAIAAQQAAGQPVPEQWHLLALQSALDTKNSAAALKLSRNLAASFPNSKNWRNALLIHRQNAADTDSATRLDLFRLMNATKALDQSDEYIGLADLLARGRFYAEAKDVIDQGAASGKVNRTSGDAAAILKEVSGKIAEDRAALAGLEGRARSGANGDLALQLAEGYFGHKDYAKAAEFYRTALQKGGVDANLVNTRLGIALGMAGRKAEAEAALKAVTGPRADLASLWMLWLSQRA